MICIIVVTDIQTSSILCIGAKKITIQYRVRRNAVTRSPVEMRTKMASQFIPVRLESLNDFPV